MNEMEQLEHMWAAVPPPDEQRLAAARAQLITAITGSRPAASHAARGPWLAISWKLRRRWLGWVVPLAAAAAVVGVILGTQGVFSTIHSPAPAASGHGLAPGLARPVTAYVAGQSGAVTPIRTATNTALAPIRIGKGPDAEQNASAIVFLPDGKTAYVLTNTLAGGPGTVIPIRTATNTALTPITVGQDPRALAITPDGKTIYVTNYQSGTVTPIRTATNTALAPIKVDGNPWAIAITPDGKTAYVANLQSGTVTPIRTATNTALTPIKVGRDPWPIAITPDGSTAYVLNGGSGTVTPIRTATNTALAPINVPEGSFNMAITPDGTTIYVLDLGSSQHKQGLVIPIRTATNTALKPITIGPAWPFVITIAITPDSKTAYVASAYTDTVTPIRTATNTALAPIKVGESPVAIAITPDGQTAYVVNFTSGPGRPGIVTPIQTATNQTLRPIKVGSLAGTIAITP
jgi:YVTN family beta-propeller protein